MTVTSELSAYLEGQGIGTRGTDLFEGRIPDEPIACVGIIEYGGFPPDYIHEQAMVAYERPTVQILVRAATYALGRAKAEAAYKAIGAILNTTLSGTRYLKATPLQSPFLLDRDANEAPRFVFNTELYKAVS